MTPITLAQAIPLKIRQVVYSILATLVGLEIVFDIIDPEAQEKLMGALVVLGFGVALSNTKATS